MRRSDRLHTGWSLPVVPGRFRSLLRNLSIDSRIAEQI